MLTDVQFEGHQLHEDGTYNRGHKAGGAIYIFQGAAIIEHVEFINNDADMEGGDFERTLTARQAGRSRLVGQVLVG